MEVSRISQFSAMAARTANSTASRFSTGSEPGRPRQTGQTFVLGCAPKAAEHEQKILRPGQQLDVDFEPDHRLVLGPRAHCGFRRGCHNR